MTLAKLLHKINQIYKIGIFQRDAYHIFDITYVYNHCCDRVCDVLIFYNSKPHLIYADEPCWYPRDDWLYLGVHQYFYNRHLARLSAY
jgi:hypothetical protein